TNGSEVIVLLSNIHAHIKVSASASSDLCVFNAAKPVCPTLARAVDLAGVRPTLIELADAVAVVDEPLVLRMPVVTIAGLATSGTSEIVCSANVPDTACLTVDTARSAKFEQIKFTGA